MDVRCKELMHKILDDGRFERMPRCHVSLYPTQEEISITWFYKENTVSESVQVLVQYNYLGKINDKVQVEVYTIKEGQIETVYQEIVNLSPNRMIGWIISLMHKYGC